ncbi:hypothetical protein V1264_006710 [Littorina saxatilis]|uniref:Transglutaminase-like domain-containing protein n=3 Tax=Littorina saxatilis TaxID=31220 RepID=A0AAN9AYC2_9CAEN
MGGACSRQTDSLDVSGRASKGNVPGRATTQQKNKNKPFTSLDQNSNVPGEEKFPPIRPPKKTKSKLIPDPEVFKDVETFVRNTPRYSARTVEGLANHLMTACSSDLDRVRAIFCWIAFNITYDTNKYANGADPPQDADSVLKTLKGVCMGYATLFHALCRHAGIPCLQVQGHAKEQYHDLEEKFTDEGKPTHAWNIVHVKGEWRPLDVTWGTGCTDNGGTFKRKFDEHWFLTDPADFVCKHYPLDKRGKAEAAKYQLLNRPIPVERFSSAIDAKSLAYVIGLKYLTHDHRVIEVTRDVTIKFKATRRPLLFVSVTLKEKGSYREGNKENILTSLSDDGTCTVYVRPPRVGTFYLEVMGRAREENENRILHELFTYVIKCKECQQDVQPFPDEAVTWGLHQPIASQCGLKTTRGGKYSFTAKNGAVKVPVPLNHRTNMKATLKHASNMRDDLSERCTVLEYTQDGAIVTARLPRPGYYMLRLFAGKNLGDNNLDQAADFLLYTDQACAVQQPYPNKPGSNGTYGLILPVAVECGLKAGNGARSSFQTTNGELKIPIQLSRFTELKVHLHHAANMSNDIAQGHTFLEYTGAGATVDVRLPRAGYYALRVFATHPTETMMPHVANFLLYAENGRSDCKPFPRAYTMAYQERVKLLKPLDGQVPRGQTTLFQIRAPTLGKVKVGDTMMERKKNGLWEGEVTPQRGTNIPVYGAKEANATTLSGLYEFTVA